MKHKYSTDDIDFLKIKTYSLKNRVSKVKISDFSSIPNWEKNKTIASLLPSLLKADELKEIVENIFLAVNQSSPVIFAMGAHVIKCGLNPLIIDLIKKGVITGVALNGAGVIHDYEIAFSSATSEDVVRELKSGNFGMAEETALMINNALKENINSHTGIGRAIGMDISKRGLPYKDLSILYACYQYNIPITVHVAIGTDIIHLHPSTDAALLGTATYNDFKLFCSIVSSLGNGGCYFNIGSSVILPEIFLKALTVTRNLGYPVEDFITVNMDMNQHYRPNMNVIKRPHQGSGKGYFLTGHHELMLPLLYIMIMERFDLPGD